MSSPTLFADFGKSCNDLLNKKYDFKNEVTVINKAANGVTVESTLGRQDTAYNGKVKVTANNATYGKFEAATDTSGRPLLAGKFESSKLVDGVKVTVKATEVPSGSVAAEYTQNNLAFSAVLAGGASNASMHVSGAFGVDGVSIGGEAKMDTVSTKVTEFGAGWQWKQSDFVGCIKTRTTQKSDNVDASYFYQKSNGTKLGAKFSYDLHKHASSMVIGTQYALDADTTLKAKAFSSGSLLAAVERRLNNPAVRVNAAAEFACPTWNTCVQSKRFGLGLTFGDF